MLRRSFRVALAALTAVLLVSVFIGLIDAQARAWVAGDEREWKILRACQDGMVVLG